MSEENDTSSATDQPVKDTAITAGDIREDLNDLVAKSFGLPLDFSLIFSAGYCAGMRYGRDKFAGIAPRTYEEELLAFSRKIEGRPITSPAEVSDKRQDWKVADEKQITREQIEAMNSGD